MNPNGRSKDLTPEEVSVPNEDDGSIDLIGFVQRYRRGFVAVTVLTVLLASAAFFLGRMLPPIEVVATTDITPTFVGAREGKYPNRAPYSPQDIVSNAVVESIWTSQGLEAAIPLAQLCRNLQVVSGGREIGQLRVEYIQKLSNTKLTSAERIALEAEYAAKTKAMNSASVTISLSGVDGMLTPDQMKRLLAAVPVQWAQQTDVVGGRSYDYPIPRGSELRASGAALAEGSAASAAVVHAERLKDFANALQTSVDALALLAGSAGVRDANGAALVDLSQELSSSRRNLVIPAYIDALAQARQSDPSGYAAIRLTRQKLIESELESAKERARVLREAFTAYADETRMTRRIIDGDRDEPARAGVLANVDGTFIDRVIEQAVKSRDVEFRRELTDRSVKADLEVVEKSAQQQFDTWLDETVVERVIDAKVVAQTTERLRRLTDQLASYSDRAQVLMQLLAARNLNPASAMFTVDVAPTVTYEQVVGTREAISGAAALWFVGVACVVVSGTLSDRRHRSAAAVAATTQALPAYPTAHPMSEIAEGRTAPRRLAAEPRERVP
jgi:hypothetical protein